MSTKKLQIVGGTILQSDWNETNATSVAYIKNKPSLQSDWNETDTSSAAYIKNKPDLQSDWDETDTTSAAYIKNKPDFIPVTTSLLKGDGSGHIAAAVAGTDYATVSHTHGAITSDGKVGTLTLSKQNLLSDATAASLGLSSTATPDDAFMALGQFEQFPVGGILETAAQSMGNNWAVTNGSYINEDKRQDYPVLFNILDYTYTYAPSNKSTLIEPVALTGMTSSTSSKILHCNNKNYLVYGYQTSFYIYEISDTGSFIQKGCPSIGVTPSSYYPIDMIYFNNKYIFLERHYSSSSSVKNTTQIYSSTDLMNWDLVKTFDPVSSGLEVSDFVIINNQLIFMYSPSSSGGSDALYISTDGTNWQSSSITYAPVTGQLVPGSVSGSKARSHLATDGTNIAIGGGSYFVQDAYLPIIYYTSSISSSSVTFNPVVITGSSGTYNANVSNIEYLDGSWFLIHRVDQTASESSYYPQAQIRTSDSITSTEWNNIGSCYTSTDGDNYSSIYQCGTKNGTPLVGFCRAYVGSETTSYGSIIYNPQTQEVLSNTAHSNFMRSYGDKMLRSYHPSSGHTSYIGVEQYTNAIQLPSVSTSGVYKYIKLK